MAFRFNPLTGVLDLDSGSSSSTAYNVDKVTLSAGDITNKYIILSTAPISKPKTRLIVITGPEQEYGVDFQVTTDDSNKRLSWDTLALDGVLAAGDKLIAIYS